MHNELQQLLRRCFQNGLALEFDPNKSLRNLQSLPDITPSQKTNNRSPLHEGKWTKLFNTKVTVQSPDRVMTDLISTGLCQVQTKALDPGMFQGLGSYALSFSLAGSASVSSLLVR